VVVVSPWFGRLDLSEASEAQLRVVQGVCDLLDQLHPDRLDPESQVVEPSEGATCVRLQHDSDPALRIEMALTDGWVNFTGVMGHDESYTISSQTADAWESDTIEILADLLLADFTIDTYELGGKRWREVVTVGPPYDLTVSKGPFLSSLLPLQRWARRVESRHATFECRGARPAHQQA
jgi:hypothetical protein